MALTEFMSRTDLGVVTYRTVCALEDLPVPSVRRGIEEVVEKPASKWSGVWTVKLVSKKTRPFHRKVKLIRAKNVKEAMVKAEVQGWKAESADLFAAYASRVDFQDTALYIEDKTREIDQTSDAPGNPNALRTNKYASVKSDVVRRIDTENFTLENIVSEPPRVTSHLTKRVAAAGPRHHTINLFNPHNNPTEQTTAARRSTTSQEEDDDDKGREEVPAQNAGVNKSNIPSVVNKTSKMDASNFFGRKTVDDRDGTKRKEVEDEPRENKVEEEKVLAKAEGKRRGRSKTTRKDVGKAAKKSRGRSDKVGEEGPAVKKRRRMMPSITLSDEESDHDDEDGTIAFGQMEDREEEEDLRYIGEGREETYVDSEVREANEKKEVKDRVGLKGTKGGAAVRNVEVVQSIENGYIVSRKLSVKKNRDMPSRTTTKERDGDARKKEEEGMEMDESPPLEGKESKVAVKDEHGKKEKRMDLEKSQVAKTKTTQGKSQRDIMSFFGRK